jgi:peptidoglycan/LPS O-acetylase OafA/YrhL
MQKVKTHLDSISLLRGLASLGICIFHIGLQVPFKWDSLIAHTIRLGEAGVFVFFIISGFVLPYSLYKKDYQWRDFKNYFLKRSVRIDLPFWASIIVIFFLVKIDFSVKNTFLNVTYLVPYVSHATWYNGVFWTLSIEMQFYIILGLTYPLLMRCKNAVLLITLTAIPLFIYNLHAVFYQGIIINYLIYFCIGFILFKIYIKQLKMVPGLSIVLLLCVHILIQVSLRVGVFSFITVAVVLFAQFRTLPVVFKYLSDISYSLYLIHWQVIVFFIKRVSHYDVNVYLLYIITVLICLAVSTIFYWLVERPALALSKKILVSRG